MCVWGGGGGTGGIFTLSKSSGVGIRLKNSRFEIDPCE